MGHRHSDLSELPTGSLPCSKLWVHQLVYAGSGQSPYFHTGLIARGWALLLLTLPLPLPAGINGNYIGGIREVNLVPSIQALLIRSQICLLPRFKKKIYLLQRPVSFCKSDPLWVQGVQMTHVKSLIAHLLLIYISMYILFNSSGIKAEAGTDTKKWNILFPSLAATRTDVHQ